jgi:hypothetical protein
MPAQGDDVGRKGRRTAAGKPQYYQTAVSAL